MIRSDRGRVCPKGQPLPQQAGRAQRRRQGPDPVRRSRCGRQRGGQAAGAREHDHHAQAERVSGGSVGGRGISAAGGGMPAVVVLPTVGEAAGACLATVPRGRPGLEEEGGPVPIHNTCCSCRKYVLSRPSRPVPFLVRPRGGRRETAVRTWTVPSSSTAVRLAAWPRRARPRGQPSWCIPPPPLVVHAPNAPPLRPPSRRPRSFPSLTRACFFGHLV